MNKVTYIIYLFLFATLVTGNVNAQKLPFQGRLLQNDIPVNDTLSINFGIDAISWSEDHSSVIVIDGLYSVVLGEISPLPDNMFSVASEHELTIDVEGTALSPVSLYPALSSGISSRFSKEGSTMQGDTAIYSEITGGADTLMYSGILSTAKTSGVNVGVRGNAISTAGIPNYQAGVWGRAEGDANAYHYGVIGQARGKGPRNMGLYGVASGEGNGTTSLDSGSYNQGVFGVGLNNPWGNIGVYGEASGTVGEDNIGVVGWSFAGDESTENNGLLGWAKGTGINKGVMGLATDGVENWSGWFEGDFWIKGQQLQVNVDSFSINDPDGRQAFVMQSMKGGNKASNFAGYGANGKENFLLWGAGPGNNYGNLMLFDSAGIGKVGMATNLQPDGRSNGWIFVEGPLENQGGYTFIGSKQWMPDSLQHLPYLRMTGKNAGQNLVLLEGNSGGNGEEMGSLSLLSTANSRHLRINPNEFVLTGPTSPNVQIQTKHWENSNLGRIALFDTSNSWNAVAELQANSSPELGDYGHASFRTTLDNRQIFINPNYIVVLGQNKPNLEMGTKFWENPDLGFVAVKSPTNNTLAGLEAFTDGNYMWGGSFFGTTQDNRSLHLSPNSLLMNGPNSQNVLFGSYLGEANAGDDRPFMWLYGSDQPSGGYAKATLEVRNNGTGDFGVISLTNALGNSTDMGPATVYLDGSNGNINIEGSLNQASDRRYKENIITLEDALSKVDNLRGVSYTLKKSPEKGSQIGLIAQEVEAVYPEFVHTNEKGFKSVNYAQMVAVLIEAIKELNVEISQLKADNQNLKAQLDQKIGNLNSRMDLLEKLLQNNGLEADASSNGK